MQSNALAHDHHFPKGANFSFQVESKSQHRQGPTPNQRWNAAVAFQQLSLSMESPEAQAQGSYVPAPTNAFSLDLLRHSPFLQLLRVWPLHMYVWATQPRIMGGGESKYLTLRCRSAREDTNGVKGRGEKEHEAKHEGILGNLNMSLCFGCERAMTTTGTTGKNLQN